MPTFKADDVSNEPTGAVQGATGPTTTQADWVPDDAPTVVRTAAKTTTAKRAAKKTAKK